MILLNSRNKKLLEQIYQEPLRADVLWADVERLFVALGGSIFEGKGSRVRVVLPLSEDEGFRRASFHRPHPRKETGKGQLRSVRRFLFNAGYRA